MKKMVFITLALISSMAFGGNLKASSAKALQSYSGSEGVGGGDLCEDRIKTIRADLKTWIENKGSEALQLPSGVSQVQYSQGMLNALAGAKIACVGPGDNNYPVEVHGTAKVCKFNVSAASKLITCDFKKFQSMTESDQYVLIHHEYAGLAGIDQPNGSDSVYTVSNQISGYLVDQVVKRLAVKPSAASFEFPKNLQLVETSDVNMMSFSFLEELKKNYKTIRCTADKNSQFDLNVLLEDSSAANPIYVYLEHKVQYFSSIYKTPDSQYFVFVYDAASASEKINVLFKMNEAGTAVLGIKVNIVKIQAQKMTNVGTVAKPVYKLLPASSQDTGTNTCYM